MDDRRARHYLRSREGWCLVIKTEWWTLCIFCTQITAPLISEIVCSPFISLTRPTFRNFFNILPNPLSYLFQWAYFSKLCLVQIHFIDSQFNSKKQCTFKCLCVCVFPSTMCCSTNSAFLHFGTDTRFIVISSWFITTTPYNFMSNTVSYVSEHKAYVNSWPSPYLSS